jgi:hypothetical protein
MATLTNRDKSMIIWNFMEELCDKHQNARENNLPTGSILNIEIDFPLIQQSIGYQLSYDELISKSKIQNNQLHFTFKLFKNADHNLSIYINSDDERKQITGTTWLLSVLGFVCMNLGIINSDDEKLIEENSQIGAADARAFQNEIGVLVIDFTTNCPKDPKVDKIRNSAKKDL